MPFPFGKSQKSPAEIVKSLKENVACLEKLETSDSKKCEKVRKKNTLRTRLAYFFHVWVYNYHSPNCLLIIVYSLHKVSEEVSKNLASLKEVLCGTADKEPQTEAVAQLAQELYNTNLLISLIANLQRIDFEVSTELALSCWLWYVVLLTSKCESVAVMMAQALSL